jgi:hypothetical protein
MLVDYIELYSHYILSLYPLVNTNKNISSVYIERITIKKNNKKKTIYNDMLF